MRRIMKLSDIRERVVYGVKLKDKSDKKLEELLLEIQLDIKDAKTKLKSKKTIEKEIKKLLKLRRQGLDPGPRPKVIPPSKPKKVINTASGTFFNQEAVEEKPGPKPNWKPQKLCQHEWVFKECKKELKYLDDDNAPEKIVAEYNRIDMYFCNKCLEEKSVKKHEIVPIGEDLRAIYEPEWY